MDLEAVEGVFDRLEEEANEAGPSGPGHWPRNLQWRCGPRRTCRWSTRAVDGMAGLLLLD
jgi:hypothetical protein